MNAQELSTDIKRLHAFFSGTLLTKIRPIIVSTGRAFIIRTPDQRPWAVTTDIANDILRDYANDIQATISGATLVLFIKAPDLPKVELPDSPGKAMLAMATAQNDHSM